MVDYAFRLRGITRPSYMDIVKRYSSGMYVRLAFAVAAHLDPEILIVDEVLAVGDAEFQKKCLGKMKDVARGVPIIYFRVRGGLSDSPFWNHKRPGLLAPVLPWEVKR